MVQHRNNRNTIAIYDSVGLLLKASDVLSTSNGETHIMYKSPT